jgi:hypothetical protein
MMNRRTTRPASDAPDISPIPIYCEQRVLQSEWKKEIFKINRVLLQRRQVKHHTHAVFFQLDDCVSGVEGAAGIADTACERQQQSGDEAGIFGVFGRKLAAVVRGQSNNKNVRYFFPFQPEGWGRRSEVVKTNCFRREIHKAAISV